MRGLLLGRSFFFLYRKSPNHVARGPVSYSVVCTRLIANRSRSGDLDLQSGAGAHEKSKIRSLQSPENLAHVPVVRKQVHMKNRHSVVCDRLIANRSSRISRGVVGDLSHAVRLANCARNVKDKKWGGVKIRRS